MRTATHASLLLSLAAGSWGCRQASSPAAADASPEIRWRTAEPEGETAISEAVPAPESEPDAPLAESEGVAVADVASEAAPGDLAAPDGQVEIAAPACAEDGTECQLPCHEDAHCQNGSCVGTPLVCPPPSDDPCVAALACDTTTGACTLEVPAAAATPCDLDDDVCTLDLCDGQGACLATAGVNTCTEEAKQDPCWIWSCKDKAGCVAAAFVEGGSCQDGNPCTASDKCTYGTLGQEVCLGTPVSVDDANPCTDDACAAGVVTHTPIEGAGCVATAPCAGAGTCQAGVCQPTVACGCASAAECTAPADPCLVASCAAGVCGTQAAAGGACSDGDPCTSGEQCLGGVCQKGVPVPCDDGNSCTADACWGGLCQHPAVPDGTGCGPDSSCQGGQCTADQVPCLHWATGAAPAASIHYGPATVVLGGAIHVLGGSPSFQHLVYTTGQGWSDGVQLPGDGVNEGGGAVIGGKIYTVHNAFDEQVRIYDPSGPSWSTGQARPTSNGRGPCVGTDGTYLYAFGGASANLAGTADAHRYEPAQDKWTDVNDLPTARGFVACVTSGGGIHVMGGRDDSTGSAIKDTHERFDLASKTWSTLEPLPKGRNSAVAGVLGGKIVVAGGFDGSSVLTRVDVYDPGTDTWASCDPMAQARIDAGGTTLAEVFYVLGGQGVQTTVELATVP